MSTQPAPPPRVARVFLVDMDNTLSDKEKSLPDVKVRYPAEHYVLIEDKPSILAAAKRLLRAEITTVLVQQGQYATSAALPDIHPGPDLVAPTIAEVGRQARAWFGG